MSPCPPKTPIVPKILVLSVFFVEKQKELGYEMVDTEIARELCVGQIEKDIDQVIDE